MSKQLRAELKQGKPFASDEEALFLNVVRTADRLLWGEVEVLRQAELTFAQYNVLRILRGAGADGLSCSEISARMVTRDSDITRLLDRLERRGLVSRVRDRHDRRVVLTRIAPDGLKLLASLDGPVTARHRTQLGHLTRAQMRELAALLDLARNAES